MILEVAILDVKEEKVAEFEPTFQEASKIISSMKGYISHELQKCMETKNRYINSKLGNTGRAYSWL